MLRKFRLIVCRWQSHEVKLGCQIPCIKHHEQGAGNPLLLSSKWSIIRCMFVFLIALCRAHKNKLELGCSVNKKKLSPELEFKKT